MKEINLNEMPPTICIYTCVATCEKGIYHDDWMEQKNGGQYCV